MMDGKVTVGAIGSLGCCHFGLVRQPVHGSPRYEGEGKGGYRGSKGQGEGGYKGSKGKIRADKEKEKGKTARLQSIAIV